MLLGRVVSSCATHILVHYQVLPVRAKVPDLDEREQAVIDFSDGKFQELSTKPVLCGNGCNFQHHCSWSIFLGIGFKFADFIQAIHRIQRFMQPKPVRIDIIYTEAEREVKKQLQRKWSQHNRMVEQMTEIIKEFGLSHAAMASQLVRKLGVERVEVTDEKYRLVNNDCVAETRGMAADSLHLVLTSIPFATQYEYSPNYADFGHSESNDEFFRQMDYLTPEMIDPAAFLDDHVRLLREGETIGDDLIRGACPAQLAFPWLPGMLGCKVRILPQTIVGEEWGCAWEEALAARLDPDNPWCAKYFEYADALVRLSGGAFPVSHAAEIGPTDLHAVLRGHTRSLLDLVDEPERSEQLLWRLGEFFRDATRAIWQRLPLFHGGYFDAQYSLWAPGPIIRMQEDATAVYSPALYRRFVQPVDRMLASSFASSFIHLHSTSMFLLEAFLEIEEIRCFEINNDELGPPLARMVPYYQRVQQAGRPLLIRGSFTPDELRLLADSLDPRGLFLNVMVTSMEEIGRLRSAAGL